MSPVQLPKLLGFRLTFRQSPHPHVETNGTLDIEVTIDDPKAYTRPWTVTLHQLLMVDTELLEFVCLENEKDIQHDPPH